MKNVKRYIPEKIDDYLKNHPHIFIKWNKDLSSEIIQLDYEGLVIACDTILRVSGSRDIDKNNFCEIQTDCFHKILQNDYKLYLDYLIDKKIIISDNWYIPGEKSISYKINEKFLSELNDINIDNKLFSKRTLNALKTQEKLKVSKDHRNNYLKTFKIDYKSAVNYLNHCYENRVSDKKGRVLNDYTRALLKHKLMQIRDGQLWINRSNTNGRINSNLTTLNGDYKQFIIGYSSSFDVVSSQPCLLNIFLDMLKYIQGKSGSNNSYLSSLLSYEYKIILKNLPKPLSTRFIDELKNVKLPFESELVKYKKWCESGLLYENFAQEVYEVTGDKKWRRSDASRQLSKDVFWSILYSSNSNNNEFKLLFSKIFPSIYNFICKIKSLIKMKRAHRMFPILMQGVESFIWVENILPRLDELKIPYLFIHDSVLTKDEYKDRVELVILEKFFMYKLSPKLK
jgi:hypothetical protein